MFYLKGRTVDECLSGGRLSSYQNISVDSVYNHFPSRVAGRRAWEGASSDQTFAPNRSPDELKSVI